MFWVSIVAVVGDYCRADGVCRSIGKITQRCGICHLAINLWGVVGGCFIVGRLFGGHWSQVGGVVGSNCW